MWCSRLEGNLFYTLRFIFSNYKRYGFFSSNAALRKAHHIEAEERKKHKSSVDLICIKSQLGRFEASWL